jgi:hypothetical protein
MSAISSFFPTPAAAAAAAGGVVAARPGRTGVSTGVSGSGGHSRAYFAGNRRALPRVAAARDYPAGRAGPPRPYGRRPRPSYKGDEEERADVFVGDHHAGEDDMDASRVGLEGRGTRTSVQP